MQRGDEDGALHWKLKGAIFQKIAKNICDPEPLPDFTKQQRSADALGARRPCAVGVFIERIDEQHLIGEFGATGEQRGQGARGGEFIGASEIGDDGLAHGSVDALVLDDLDVAAFAELFDAEVHGGLDQPPRNPIHGH